MRNYLLISLFIMLYSISNAQDRTFESVNMQAHSYALDLLKNEETEKILIYKTGCIGCPILNECKCSSGTIKSFLFWKEANKSYVIEINCCETTEKKETDIGAVWQELETNQEAIYNSKFKGKKKSSHYDFYEVKVISKESSQKIEMSDFYFDDDNKYHKQNSRQAARKFQKLINVILMSEDQP